MREHGRMATEDRGSGGLRDLIDEYGGKALRYSSVSIMGVLITQILIVVLYNGVGLAAWVTNFIAVTISSIPAYMLNRAWVWNKHSSHSMTREVLPFWGMALLGLVISTIAVAIVSQYTDAVIAISLTNIASFGVLWVGKFLILEKWMFKAEHPIAASEPWVAADPTEGHAS
jgi:putative flippase GtrA